MELILVVLLLIPTFLIWSIIHELSHFLTAKLLWQAQLVHMKLYPHKGESGFVWASVRYRIPSRSHRKVTPKNLYRVSWAPRLPGLIACLASPFVFLLPEVRQVPMFILLAGGATDLLNGTLGFRSWRSPTHDLQRAAKAKGVHPNKLRKLALVALPTLITGLVLFL